MSQCENCGATGIDPGSLRRPEPCPRCQGQKFVPSAFATMDRATAAKVWNQIEDHRRHREAFGL